MKVMATVCIGFLLLLTGIQVQSVNPDQEDMALSSCCVVPQSIRAFIGDAVIVPERDPFFSLMSTSIACWYERSANTSGLLPLLVSHDGCLTAEQMRFLDSYVISSDQTLLVLGDPINTTYPTIEFFGSAPMVSLSLASQVFLTAPTVLIIPYGTDEAYHLSLVAAPLASYLNIPILIFDENEVEIQNVCMQLQTTDAYLIGNFSLELPTITTTVLSSEKEILDTIFTVVKERFGSLSYLTLTNPSDVLPPQVVSTTGHTFHDSIVNTKIILLNKEFDIVGNDTRSYQISIPDGINHVQINGEIHQRQRTLFTLYNQISPLLFMTLFDEHGQIVAYANSMGYDVGKTYLETLTCNASGVYTLTISVYHGLKGGFFIQRGVSFTDANVTIYVNTSALTSAHHPAIPGLSCLAAYLTAAHGGVVLANASWELTDESYITAAQGLAAGPWYNEILHNFTNNKVNQTVQQVQGVLDQLESHDLLSGYLNGPAWLAILADPTMIPMYYYGPSQEDIAERGLPSDNPYSFHQNLSVGRLIGWDVQDVSVLIARTFFYESVCGPSQQSDDWHHRFSFMFGEGFGETGGIFHQIPYAREIKEYGFDSAVYGILRNGREFVEAFSVFTGANYNEYLGHGDWFWMPASFYGLDMYSKAIDVAHAKDWVFDKPSVFLTSACLLGRTDGLPPEMNIGLTLLHAGCNCFVGATRETGQEAGLTILENHLIVDNWSIGEALRGEKRVDMELPTFYVRVLYGDPAFNPFEPQHGFSNQGRPILVEN
jgi:hypothetical protein